MLTSVDDALLASDLQTSRSDDEPQAGDLMPEDERETVATIARQIEAYLNRHPMAADTIEGVANWWLPRQVANVELVQQALDSLVADRRLVCRNSADGQTLYARRRDDSA